MKKPKDYLCPFKFYSDHILQTFQIITSYQTIKAITLSLMRKLINSCNKVSNLALFCIVNHEETSPSDDILLSLSV